MRPPRILPIHPVELVLASPLFPVPRKTCYHQGTGYLYFGVSDPPAEYRFVHLGGVLAVAALWVGTPLQEMGGVLDHDAFGIVYFPPAIGRILSLRIAQIPIAVSIQPRLELPWPDTKMATNSSAWQIETWGIQAPTWPTLEITEGVEELWAKNWEADLYFQLSPKSSTTRS